MSGKKEPTHDEIMKTLLVYGGRYVPDGYIGSVGMFVKEIAEYQANAKKEHICSCPFCKIGIHNTKNKY